MKLVDSSAIYEPVEFIFNLINVAVTLFVLCLFHYENFFFTFILNTQNNILPFIE